MDIAIAIEGTIFFFFFPCCSASGGFMRFLESTNVRFHIRKHSLDCAFVIFTFTFEKGGRGKL